MSLGFVVSAIEDLKLFIGQEAAGVQPHHANWLYAQLTALDVALSPEVGAGFTSALTVNVATGDDTIDGSASTAALTIAAAAASIDANDTLKGGTGTGDVLSITADNDGTGAVFGATVSGFETLTVLAGSTATNTVKITTNDGMLTTLTVNASALTNASAALTFVGSAELTGSYVITGGAGNDAITGALNSTTGANTIDGGAGDDTITAGAGADSLVGGTGNDTFQFLSANFTTADAVAGGVETADTIKVTDASTVIDADFTNVTGIEILTTSAAPAQTVTLGALAMAAGIKTITGGTTGVDTVTVGAGFTSALTVNVNTGTDSIDGSASTAALTIAAAAASVTAADTLNGGTSTGDVLSLTADNGTATITKISGIETITVVASATPTDDIIIVMGANDTQIGTGKTLTVNAAALTDTGATLTFTGTASETDGFLSITGGAGGDTISGGAAADTISGGAGADSITGGTGNDSVVGGTGADTVVSGLGVDTITLGTGSDTDADVIAFDMTGLVTATSVVTDFDAQTNATSEDLVKVTSNGTGWAAAATVKQSTASSATDAELVILDSQSYSTATDAAAAADNLQHNAAIKEYLFVWTDTSSVVHVSWAIQDAITEVATDQFVDLVKLTGVAIGNLNLGDFTYA